MTNDEQLLVCVLDAHIVLFGVVRADIIDPGARVDTVRHDHAGPHNVENRESFHHPPGELIVPEMPLQLVLGEGLLVQAVDGVDRDEQDRLQASLGDVGVELVAARPVLHPQSVLASVSPVVVDDD